MDVAELLLLSLLCVVFGSVSPTCMFPPEWRGRWYQDTKGEHLITTTEFQRKGICQRNEGNKYVLFNSDLSCYMCVVMTQMHPNIIQYKESYCIITSQSDICNHINGDAQQYTMVKVPSVPVPCPFQGQYLFSYTNSTNGHHCASPRSSIRACADPSRFKFVYNHCRGMANTYDQELDFQCLATWENGEKFLYGKFSGYSVMEPDNMYRCFMHNFYGGGGDMSMSADATCQGLQSPSVGFATMKIDKDFQGESTPRCRFPTFFSRTTSWRDFSGRYLVEVDDIKRFRIKDRAADTFIYSDQRARSEVKLVASCVGEVNGYASNVAEFIAHVTDDNCESGFKCIRFIDRSKGKFLEIHMGLMFQDRNNACSDTTFQRGEQYMLIPADIKPTVCPTQGVFQFIDKSSSCEGSFAIGCGSQSSIVAEKKCQAHHGTRQSVTIVDCLAEFTDDNSQYVIVQKDALRKEAACLAFRNTEEGIEVLEDSECGSSRTIRPELINFLLFKPLYTCPVTTTRPPTYYPPRDIVSSRPDINSIQNPNDQGRSESTNSKITAESSNGVIDATTGASACNAHVWLLGVTCVTFYLLHQR